MTSRLKLMHDTANCTLAIRSYVAGMQRQMEAGETKEEDLKRCLDGINAVVENLKGVLDKWYIEDKAKEDAERV